jgi:outer membrane protein
MAMFRSLSLCAVLACAAGVVSAQQRTVTLADALRLSERVQPDVVRASAAIRTAGAQRRNAWGSFLPNVTANSSANEFYTEGAPRLDPVTGQITGGNSTNRSVSTGLSASVDLFTGFRRRAELRSARAGEDAAEASFIDARFQQALTTTNQFLAALAAGQLLRVRESSVRRAEEQLKVSVAKLHTGSATRSDSLRSLVTLGNARLDQLTTQTDLAAAEANLARLIGETGRVKAADDSAFYAVVPELDAQALRAEAESKSPRVQSAVANAAAARSSVSASRSAYWPTLALSGTTNWSGSQGNDYDFLNQSQVSLGFRWNLFDRFDRELAITQREADRDVAEANAADARLGVAADLELRLAELGSANSRIEITRTSVVAAGEDLRVQQERYRLGAATIVDVLTSQEALNQAEVDVVNARFDYLRARAQIEALIGRKL